MSKIYLDFVMDFLCLLPTGCSFISRDIERCGKKIVGWDGKCFNTKHFFYSKVVDVGAQTCPCTIFTLSHVRFQMNFQAASCKSAVNVQIFCVLLGTCILKSIQIDFSLVEKKHSVILIKPYILRCHFCLP